MCVHMNTCMIFSKLLTPVQYRLDGSRENLSELGSCCFLTFEYSFTVCDIKIFLQSSNVILKIMNRCLVYSISHSLSSIVVPDCPQLLL